MFENLTQDPRFWGLASLAPYVFLALRSRFRLRGKRPLYGAQAVTLAEGMGSKLPGLEVRFRGEKQDRITITRIYFWNAGREVIRRADIATLEPIRVGVQPGADLLGQQIHTVSRTVCNVSSRTMQASDGPAAADIVIDFEFLDYGDGFVVELVHNGPVDHPVEMCGAMVGAEDLQRVSCYPSGVVYGTGWTRWYGLAHLASLGVFGGLGYAFAAIAFGEGLWGIVIGVSLGMLLASFEIRLADLIVPTLPRSLRPAVLV